ncbi:hypothetical protein EV129_12226 [Rhizobium azibense]|uniref:Uncharacterized protein n=1 Tax=Rhizobium azibense TaxID=1136135 RepID=A0A4R3R9U7_9HYPH|nr:hypothetical protein EV129_12226 [Rhizobium azibense]
MRFWQEIQALPRCVCRSLSEGSQFKNAAFGRHFFLREIGLAVKDNVLATTVS